MKSEDMRLSSVNIGSKRCRPEDDIRERRGENGDLPYYNYITASGKWQNSQYLRGFLLRIRLGIEYNAFKIIAHSWVFSNCRASLYARLKHCFLIRRSIQYGPKLVSVGLQDAPLQAPSKALQRYFDGRFCLLRYQRIR